MSVFGRIRYQLLRVLTMSLVISGAVSHLFAKDGCNAENSPEVVGQMIQHELSSAPSQGRWIYTVAYLSQGAQMVARRVETDDGVFTWLVSRGGFRLSDAENAAQHDSIMKMIASPDLLARNRKAAQDDANRINALLADIPRVVRFSCLIRRKDMATVMFDPKTDFSPENNEERLVAGMNGTIDFDLASMRLVAINAALKNDLALFLGLARINKGSSIRLRRAKMSTGAWETTSFSTHINGHVFFLKTIAQDNDESRYEYCPVPPHLKALDAITYLTDTKCPH